MSDASIALHEAGHATVAMALGRTVLSMRLDADGGVTEFAPPAHREDRRAVRELLVVLAAGDAAEAVCSPPVPEEGAWRL
jgi:hypothetical protein